jgi:hypothetical protein
LIYLKFFGEEQKMRRHIKYFTLGTIVLLCLAGCESLEEYDILGEWDFTGIDNTTGISVNGIATFQGSKEGGTGTIVPDSDGEMLNLTYIVISNHVSMHKSCGSLPPDCGYDCGPCFEGDFTGADSISGTAYDDHDGKRPPESGTWTMTRR